MTKRTQKDREIFETMLDNCQNIMNCRKRFGDDEDVFKQDEDYFSAVCMYLLQIGESVNSVSDEAKETWPAIPWHQMYGMRNIIVHGYGAISKDRVWRTMIQDVPMLMEAIENILEEY